MRAGIRHFEAKEFDQAAEAFDEAGKALPDDPRVTFDRATAYAAKGRYDEASALFQQAAMARDADLALRSRYNLAGVATGRAIQILGEKPDQAPPPVRQEALRWLGTALAHYREVLQIDPQHADARHNIELIRLWIRHIEARWREYDQEQVRRLPLHEYVRWLEAQQRALRARSAACQDKPLSPEVRAELDAIAEAQATLAEEIGPLWKKIATEVGNGGAAGSSAMSREAIAALQERAAKAGRAMAEAQAALGDVRKKVGSETQPTVAQGAAVEELDGIATDLSPFGALVQQAIERQKQEIDRVAPAVEKLDPARELDSAERAWEERFITRWSERLSALARAQLEQEDDPTPHALTPEPSTPSAGQRAAMQKAAELAPRVVELTDQAANDLQASRPAEALPRQREALRLLKEMQESLPPESQPQSAPQCDNPRAGSQGPEPKATSQPSDSPQPDRRESEGTEGDSGSAEPGKGDEEEPPAESPEPGGEVRQAGQQPPKPAQSRSGEMTPEEAEALLRRARQRTAERLEHERELRALRFVPDPVEKDW